MSSRKGRKRKLVKELDEIVLLDSELVLYHNYAYFVPYAYGTYHMRIRVRYNHTRMVRKIVPSEYS